MSACEKCRWHQTTEPTTGYMLTHFCSLLDSWPFNLPDECKWQNFDMSANRACGNCIHFIGLGDWGLGCRKDYYKLPRKVTDATDCKDYEVDA